MVATDRGSKKFPAAAAATVVNSVLRFTTPPGMAGSEQL
jgi:hypothetical protein